MASLFFVSSLRYRTYIFAHHMKRNENSGSSGIYQYNTPILTYFDAQIIGLTKYSQI